MKYFDLENLSLRYRPFPIGLARPLFAPDLYAELLDAYPSKERCVPLDKVGSKFTLSEKFNPKDFEAFIADSPVWRGFHLWLKGPDFLQMVIAALEARNVDLGFKGPMSTWERKKRHFSAFLHGRSNYRSLELSTRMEFSMLPSSGGHVLPHADGFSKIITLVVAMARPGEWDPAWGGGTDLLRPKDQTLDFNRVNRQLPFDEMEVLDTFPFEANQAVLFVKTFNSWHSVRPMTGPGPEVLRRTLTINIELPT
ncbi:MAG: hypothetical protein H6807_00940 [Planctomycetes bacterium]|nr:hypothetical protein [Planctomycetota bacterium]